MKEAYQRNHILAKGKDVFIGIDVYTESWQVTVCHHALERDYVIY